MIDLSNYSMPIGNTETFSYDIQVPAGLNYNEVSYSDHAVYFCLDTTEGKLKTQTEPNKLGFKIAKKFDVEITKYEINTDKRLSGVTFSAEEKDSENVKTATTFSDGVATLKGLFVEKEYTIKEIRADRKYVVDDKNTVTAYCNVTFNLENNLKGTYQYTPSYLFQSNSDNKKFKSGQMVLSREEAYKTIARGTLTKTCYVYGANVDLVRSI